jgi:hypothetical protein
MSNVNEEKRRIISLCKTVNCNKAAKEMNKVDLKG